MNKKILIFHGSEELNRKLKAISCSVGAELIAVPLCMYNHTASELTGIKDMNRSAMEYNEKELSMEMVLFAGLTDKDLDVFLDNCKKENVQIRLKAVLTDTNGNWKIIDLYKELMKEYLFYKMRGK